MVVSIIGTTSNSGDPGTTTSASWAHTCATGTTCLVVLVGTLDSNLSDRQVSGITYNSVPLSIATYNDGNASNRAEIWYLLNPTTGSSNDIAITFGGKCSDSYGVGVNLSGTPTTGTPFDIMSISGSTIVTVSDLRILSASSVLSGSLALGVNASDVTSDTITQYTGTELSKLDVGNVMYMSYDEESSNNVHISWLKPGGYQNSAICGVSFRPSDTTVNNIVRCVITNVSA